MPYSVTGVYTPAAGAESAAPGQVIQSAVWNAIFTDLAAALTLLGTNLASEPVTKTGTSGTVGITEGSTIFNASGTYTVTLPAASANPGRVWDAKSIAANAVNSATSNIVPLAGGAAGTAILASGAGKWATLQSDGTNWIIMASN